MEWLAYPTHPKLANLATLATHPKLAKLANLATHPKLAKKANLANLAAQPNLAKLAKQAMQVMQAMQAMLAMQGQSSPKLTFPEKNLQSTLFFFFSVFLHQVWVGGVDLPKARMRKDHPKLERQQQVNSFFLPADLSVSLIEIL